MAVDNHQLEIYQKIWTLILNDADFRSISGVTVGPNNQIRVDSGKVNSVKKTAGQDGDLPELAISIGIMTDNGDDGTDDETRPTFGVVEGVTGCDDPTVITYEYPATLTYPTERFEEFFPLLEVIRRNIRGYKLKNSGLSYVRNTKLEATFNRAAEFRQTIRPQHQITITVEVQKN